MYVFMTFIGNQAFIFICIFRIYLVTHRSIDQTMDVERVFRSLVSNQIIPDLNDFLIRFSFKTVYYQSVDSYCCCECAFQNEFLTYIDEDGVINEEVYDKIIQSIKDGKCPHVNNIDERFVKESSIYGVNIAAAVNTYDAVSNYLLFVSHRSTFSDSIFHLRPFHLAALKQRMDILRLILSGSSDDTLISGFCISLVPEIKITESGIHLSPNKPPAIQISTYTYKALEYAVKMNNIECFELLSQRPKKGKHLLEGFIFAFRENLTQFQKAFEHNFKGLLKRETYVCRLLPIDMIERIKEMSALPVLYEKANVFDKMLKILKSSNLDEEPDILKFLSAVCYCLKRDSCMDILRNYSHTNHHHTSYEQVKMLLHLLCRVSDFREEIMSQLFKIHDLKEVINTPDESEVFLSAWPD